MVINEYYKKEKELRTFNSVKYYVMSLVLDILVRRMVINRITNANEVEIPFKELMQEIWKDSTYDMEWKISVARVELIVVEMSWMNLIENTGDTSKNPNIKLTDQGFAAYKDQRFHLIAANLMEAKESRNLSIIALIISIFTLFVTVIGLLVAN